jgi:hypothetical protein
MDPRAFLKAVDTNVWVEKRLFPTVLIALDDVTKSSVCSSFMWEAVNHILFLGEGWELTNDQTLADHFEKEGFASMIVMALKRIRGGAPDSRLAQFISDLETYGLREALGYVFTYEVYIPDATQEAFLQGYERVGRHFLESQQEVHQRLIAKAQELNGKTTFGTAFEILLKRSLILNDDPWADGLPQERISNA